jgi:GNAT superfamily N-acetyltransferase
VRSRGLVVRAAVEDDLAFLRKMLYDGGESPGTAWPGLLMDALIAEARASGVTAITLRTGLFNDAAVRLYRRRGFAEPFSRGDGVQMRLALD